MKQRAQLEKLKNQVVMTVTGEGLRIELTETAAGTFFQTGSSSPSNSGKDMLKMMSSELGKMHNDLLIEGHTDAHPFASNNGYSNWELSTDDNRVSMSSEGSGGAMRSMPMPGIVVIASFRAQRSLT